jgi:hypothetical protein
LEKANKLNYNEITNPDFLHQFDDFFKSIVNERSEDKRKFYSNILTNALDNSFDNSWSQTAKIILEQVSALHCKILYEIIHMIYDWEQSDFFDNSKNVIEGADIFLIMGIKWPEEKNESARKYGHVPGLEYRSKNRRMEIKADLDYLESLNLITINSDIKVKITALGNRFINWLIAYPERQIYLQSAV